MWLNFNFVYRDKCILYVGIFMFFHGPAGPRRVIGGFFPRRERGGEAPELYYYFLFYVIFLVYSYIIITFFYNFKYIFLQCKIFGWCKISGDGISFMEFIFLFFKMPALYMLSKTYKKYYSYFLFYILFTLNFIFFSNFFYIFFFIYSLSLWYYSI